MQKYFIATTLCLIVLFLQGSTAETISCHVNSVGGKVTNETDCSFCGYMDVESSKIANDLNGISRYCLKEQKLTYYDGSNPQSFTTLNVCQNYTDNNQINNLYLCDTDECNWECVVGGAFSTTLNIFGLILSILISIKLC